MKRPSADKLTGGIAVPWEDPWFKGEYPFLTEFLTATQYEDGTARATGTILLFVDNGCMKLVLNDRDNQRSAFIEKSELLEAFAAAEAGLRNESLTWKIRGGYNSGPNKTPF